MDHRSTFKSMGLSSEPLLSQEVDQFSLPYPHTICKLPHSLQGASLATKGNKMWPLYHLWLYPYTETGKSEKILETILFPWGFFWSPWDTKSLSGTIPNASAGWAGFPGELLYWSDWDGCVALWCVNSFYWLIFPSSKPWLGKHRRGLLVHFRAPRKW